MSLEYKPFNLHNCVQSTIYPLRLRAEEKHIELRAQIAQDAPQWIMGDLFRTRQILNNLIGNAVKVMLEDRTSRDPSTDGCSFTAYSSLRRDQ